MKPNIKSIKKPVHFLDRVGIFLSGLCAVHCVLIPALLLIMPVFGTFSWVEGSIVHQILFYSVLVSGALAIYLGYRIHSELKPVVLLVIGLAIVFFGTFFAHDLLGHVSEYIINPIGGLFLIWAHYSNHTKRHLAEHKNCSSCAHTH